MDCHATNDVRSNGSSCPHAGGTTRAASRRSNPPLRIQAARWRQSNLVRCSVQTILVVDRYQNLVNVGLQYHASHDDLVQHVVDLEHDREQDTGNRMLGYNTFLVARTTTIIDKNTYRALYSYPGPFQRWYCLFPPNMLPRLLGE